MLVSLFLMGCSQPGGIDCSTVTVDNEAHTNIATLSWSSALAGTSSVTYTVDGQATTINASADESTEHVAVLRGLPALTDVSWSALTDVDGEASSCEGVLTTRNLPAGLPQLEITVSESGQSSEPYMLGLAQAGDSTYPFILDRSGQWVWYWPDNQIESSMHGERAADGNGLMLSSFAFERTVDEGMVYRVSATGEELDTYRMTLGHHVFDQVPHAELSYLAIDVREWTNGLGNVEPVVGDAIVEIQDGQEVTIFSTWDWAEPEEHEEWTSTFYPQGRDWTHANSLHYDPDDNTYLISLAYPRTILQVDATSGEVVDEISAETRTLTDETLGFREQHDVRWTEEGTLMAFNHYAGQSGCVEYEVTAETLTPIWTHGLEESIVGTIQGQCYRLENGNTLVNFGGAGIVREVTPGGEVVWEVQSGLGAWVSNVEMFSDIYSF